MTGGGRSLLHALRHRLQLDPPHTQTTDAERSALEKYAQGKHRAAELGVYEGANTTRIARALAPSGVLYAIDPFFRGRLGISWEERIARAEVRRHGQASRVRFVPALSWEACGQIGGMFDFVFVDGDHSLDGITRDWSDWSARIEPGGVIALHDTRLAPGVGGVEALGSHHYFESHIRRDPRFEILEQVDSLSVLRRLPGDQTTVSSV